MAKIDLLLQAITPAYHADALRKLLSIPGTQRVIASVAFVREDGVNAVAAELKAVAKVATFFLGIRNDITSKQALLKLLKLGVKVFAVDTASRRLIFHPKVFLVRGKNGAAAIVGSANMTFGGLHNNIEAGALLALDLQDPSDKKFVESSEQILDELPTRFPHHVVLVKDADAVEALFDDGRLVDEDVVVAAPAASSVRRGNRDQLPVMRLERHASPERRRRRAARPPAAAPAPAVAAPIAPALAAPFPDFELIWESRGLTERDLNIPTGARTHATGSMLWKKGAAEDIDQRHFFRDEAFEGLNWQTDPNIRHYERAEAVFNIVIKGLNYGAFPLKLSHNTDTHSRSYAQKNSMTQIHWGAAMRIVAKRDLLGRTMSLYRKDANPPEFLIEID